MYHVGSMRARIKDVVTFLRRVLKLLKSNEYVWLTMYACEALNAFMMPICCWRYTVRGGLDKWFE